MSRSFVAASSEFIENNTAVPVSGFPYTAFIWMRPTTLNTVITIAFADASVGNVKNLSRLSDFDASADIECSNVAKNTTTRTIQGTTAVSLNVWHTETAQYNGDTSRELFFEGVSEGTGTASSTFSANFDVISIGRIGDSTPGNFMDGELAHGCIWDVTLSQNELDILQRGVNPFIVDNDNLVFYCPVEGNNSPEPDLIAQALKMTVGGTPLKFAGDPPVELLENFL